MSGVVIGGELLLTSVPLLAIVPEARIKAWLLAQGMPVPSILVTSVSRVEQQFLAKQPFRLVTERVQATVRAATGEQREAIRGLIRDAWDQRQGTLAGFSNVSVLLAGTGPDFSDDAASIFMGSIDARVSFSEPA